MTDPIPSTFLTDLPVFSAFEDVADISRYRALPDDWVLALADVVSSTEAIAQGRYKMVNMAGAAVITAVLNALAQKNSVFVFGGDGAAIAVPPEGIDVARGALADVARWILDDLGLTMRTAIVPVTAIRATGREVLIARYRASDDVTFAMFAGGGSSWAEAQMKTGNFAVGMAAPGSRPDLAGLSCRWNPIKSRNGQIVSIIAVPGSAVVADAFRSMVVEVLAIANEAGTTGNPLPQEGPRPVVHFGGMAAEARASAPPGKRFMARVGVAVAVLLTVFLHRTNLSLGGFNARRYTRQVTQNSDFRKYDDGLKMTIDIDAAQLARLEACLGAAEAKGVCRFGLHLQDAALVTCMVPSVLTRDHIHFIDGAAGGYAQAATRMKAKIAAIVPQGSRAS